VWPAVEDERSEVFGSQHCVHPPKEILPLPDQKFEAPPFARVDAGDLQDQVGEWADLIIGQGAQDLQPFDVPG